MYFFRLSELKVRASCYTWVRVTHKQLQFFWYTLIEHTWISLFYCVNQHLFNKEGDTAEMSIVEIIFRPSSYNIRLAGFKQLNWTEISTHRLYHLSLTHIMKLFLCLSNNRCERLVDFRRRHLFARNISCSETCQLTHLDIVHIYPIRKESNNQLITIYIYIYIYIYI